MKDWRTQEHVGLKVEADGHTAVVTLHNPPAHGSRPTVASGSATWACSSMMRRSQARAHSSPPPIA